MDENPLSLKSAFVKALLFFLTQLKVSWQKIAAKYTGRHNTSDGCVLLTNIAQVGLAGAPLCLPACLPEAVV